MSINIRKSDVVAEYRFTSLSEDLEKWVKSDQVENPNPENVTVIFNHYLKKIPVVKEKIQQLSNYHCISEVHSSMTLSMIFFTYLDDLIEHYQAQQENRDEELDKQLQDIKLLFAHGRYGPANQNLKQLNVFLKEIRSKLNHFDILPSNFDHIISAWSDILQIQYIGDLSIASLYANYPKHHKNPPQKATTVNISRRRLEKCFTMVLRQVSKDFAWIANEIRTKMPEQGNVDLLLSKEMTNPFYPSPTPLSDQRRIYEIEMQQSLLALSSLNFNDNKALETLAHRVEDVTRKLCPDAKKITTWENYVKERPIFALLGQERHSIMNRELQNYNECGLIKDTFLDTRLIYLAKLMRSLILSNNIWKNYQKTKVIPVLVSDISSLFPTPVSVIQYDEKMMNELLSNSLPQKTQKQPNSVAKKNVQKGKTLIDRKKKQPLKTEIKIQSKSNTSKSLLPQINQVSENTEPNPLQINFTEELRTKLYVLYTRHPSTALRQALWHLEALLAYQECFDDLDSRLVNSLTIVNAVTNSAHKLLEQTYRFCLRKEGVPLPTEHNLKFYYQELHPGSTDYPEIVQKLYLANTWCRYFYPKHASLKGMSTQIADIPPVMDLLVKMAEGQTPSPNSLHQFVHETVDQACLHVNYLLKHMSIPDSASVQRIQKQPIKLTAPLKVDIYHPVSKSFENFLKKFHLNSYHPVYLSIKQSLISMKMLEVSLQQMNQAKDLHAFSAWSVYSLQQLQESMENALHAIEYFQYGTTSIDHEMNKLSEKIRLDMGELATAYHHLSYKTRYPAEFLEETMPAQIINDLEVLKQYPEIMTGFQLQSQPKILWKMPTKNASPQTIMQELMQLIDTSARFLSTQVFPALQVAYSEKRKE